MTAANLSLFIFFLMLAGIVFLSLLNDILRWAYRIGYARGRNDAETWWIEQDSKVNEAREKIWKEEG